MGDLLEDFSLKPDEIALYFRSESGIEARDLGIFLQRVATIARQEKAELRVVSVEPGSLAVRLRALARSATKEFQDTPVKTSGGASAIVGTVVAAVAWSMHAEAPTPAARAGANLIEECEVEEIRILTIEKNILLMDKHRAWEVRQQEKPKAHLLSKGPLERLLAEADSGDLEGEVLDVEGKLHMRPRGFSYLVPIKIESPKVYEADQLLHPGALVRVTARLITNQGQPELLLVRQVRKASSS